MLYEIDELLNEAIMTKVPSVLVEGVDDIEVYDAICGFVTHDVEIYAIETIKGFSRGCEQVILALRNLHSLPESEEKVSQHILGIIDKDVRDFRGEIPELDSLLVLNFYSIESHFVSENVLKNILEISLKTNKGLITGDLITLLMIAVDEHLLGLYYCSLESLKHSLQPAYEHHFGYSFPNDRIKDPNVQRELREKRADLNDFAKDVGVSQDIDSLKRIARGSWLVNEFASIAFKELKMLPQMCSDDLIAKCKVCMTGAVENCLYRVKKGIAKETIRSIALTFIDVGEVEYIINRIEDMENIS